MANIFFSNLGPLQEKEVHSLYEKGPEPKKKKKKKARESVPFVKGTSLGGFFFSFVRIFKLLFCLLPKKRIREGGTTKGKSPGQPRVEGEFCSLY